MVNLMDYGFIPTMMPEYACGIPARVTAVHRERYELICEYGYVYGKLKSSIYYLNSSELFPITGDFVLIDYNPYGDSMIIKTLERKSFFSRRDPLPGKGEQAIVANFDYVFIMQSLNHDFNIKRMERYITLALQSQAVPVIVLTKADLVEDYSEHVREVNKVAKGIGVYAISVKAGFGLDMLKDYLKPRKTIVLLGSSGVGKSSFVNTLAGQEIMSVGDIREDDSKGRHTTTHRQLFMLPNGVMVIDTPGMRELGMWDVSVGLNEAFGDVEIYFDKCKFRDCSHQFEPGCAVKAAIERGELSKERWESYLKLKQEAEYTEDKANYLRKKQEWHKDLSKRSKIMKKNDENKKWTAIY